MNSLRKSLRQVKVLKALSSIKITVGCLCLLFILTLWGTIAQVNQGLYHAQEQFFHSWYFIAAGFIPFPGAQLVLWILFINLVCVSITRFVYQWSHIGITIIHIGLLTYFVAAFVTFHVVEESNLSLYEGEASNVSQAYHHWELSVWEERGEPKRKVLAYDTDSLRPGNVLSFDEPGLVMTVKSYYTNAQAFISDADNKDKVLNDSGITSLTKTAADIEPEKNIPGVVLNVKGKGFDTFDMILFGAQANPTKIKVERTIYNVMLRRKRYELPFILTLKDFQKEMHPGTEIPKSFKSFVDISYQGLSRDVKIWMNNPLRHKDYTLYQASYAIDQSGRERSTLAVVKNAGRILPYAASLITFLGLAVHFLMMGFAAKRNRKRNK